MVRSGDQGVSPPRRAPKVIGAAAPSLWPFGVSFVERGLCVMSTLFLLSFRENSFVLIVGCLPHTSFLLSFIDNMVETKERQQRDKIYNNNYLNHLHAGLIITKANFQK